MRVLHVYSGNLWGGIEAMLATIARHQGQAGLDTHEFALCFRDRLAAAVVGAGAVVHDLGPVRLRAPRSLLRARRALATVLRTDRFDAVIYHAAWSYALFGGVTRPEGTRTVFWMHDVATGSHWTERLAKRVGPPTCLVSNSDFTATSAAALWPDTRAVTVHCPVSMESPPPDGTREQTRAELGCDPSVVALIQVGRLEEWKGHLVLIDALTWLGDVPHWEYWIVGGAQRPAEVVYESRLRAHAERAGLADRVRFLGQRSDVHGLLAAADLFCQPTAAPEPFGVAIIEALAAGLPVIATSPGGAAEIVDDTCGVLVGSGHADELARALRHLLRDPRRRRAMGDAGPARARFIADPHRQLTRLRETILAAPMIR